MDMVFLGPPGAGKGTMASRLSAAISVPHISTGDIFRYHISNQTELGLQVKSILDSGKLVPDTLTIDLVTERLGRDDVASGYILDGFPRTVAQADALQQIRAPQLVVNFVLDDEQVLRRLGGRRVHKASGRTYHVEFNPPKVAGKDDETGDDLEQRPDDAPDAIQVRLDAYREQTEPLISYYRSRDVLLDLDAAPSPDSVYESLRTRVT